jgi:hypothetical protein
MHWIQHLARQESVSVNTIQHCVLVVGVFSPQVIPLLGPATDTVCYQLGWDGMNSFYFGFSVWFGIYIVGPIRQKSRNYYVHFLFFSFKMIFYVKCEGAKFVYKPLFISCQLWPFSPPLLSLCCHLAATLAFSQRRICRIHDLIMVVCLHGQINYLDNKTKCRHLKKLTCKGVFAAGVYQTGDSVRHVVIFVPAL